MQQKLTWWKCLVVGLLLINFSVSTTAQQLLDPHTQPRFINPLPVPSVINGQNGGLFTIDITQQEQWLGLVDPNTQQHLYTTVWGYNNTYPGPSILAKKNIPIEIYWRNKLTNGSGQPLPHILPVDSSLHWALEGYPGWQNAGVPIVTHLHGGHSESASDGLPEAWFTPNFNLKGQGFIKGDVEPYFYHNSQEAASLFYHDHALGITRLNVYAGLAGFYLITDENEMDLQATGKLPAAPYDLGLAIQDKMFTADGKLYYPSEPEEEEGNEPSPSALPEMFGDFIIINGMAWPVLDVEPRPYRFRIVNGSDSRFYNMYLSNGLKMTQIGTDDGFLPVPVEMHQLLIGPGERKDIIIDFSKQSLQGKTIILGNNARTPFPKGEPPDPHTTGQMMAFRVSKSFNNSYPITVLPTTLRPPIVPLTTTLESRKLILFEGLDEFGRLKPMLGTVEDGALGWHDPITENPMLDSVEIWEIFNETEDAHTIHLHMVSMQLINRQKFHAEVDEETGKPEEIILIGPPKPPPPDELGWKDTWVMFPGEVTRVTAKFDIEGLYVWHCHILSHEDHEMMRPYYVGDMQIQLPMKKTIKEAPGLLESELQLRVMPNPFSNNVTIRFTLPKTEKVLIRLYDSKGSLIRQVFNGERSAGMQNFTIDGTNMANGIYFCEIIIDGKRISRKLVLQK